MQERGQVVLAALVIGMLIGAAATYGLGGARTTTLTETTTSTVAPSSIPLYKVTFNETGMACGYGPALSYAYRWYATLGNLTMVQPSNATLPFPNPGYGAGSPAYAMISTIIFTVPDGTYSYRVSLGDLNGTVNVNGSNVVIPVEGPLCPP